MVGLATYTWAAGFRLLASLREGLLEAEEHEAQDDAPEDREGRDRRIGNDLVLEEAGVRGLRGEEPRSCPQRRRLGRRPRDGGSARGAGLCYEDARRATQELQGC